MSFSDNKKLYNQTGNIDISKKWKFAVLTAEWNSEITFSLRDAAIKTLNNAGINDENIISKEVPGSFELICGAKLFAEKANVDAVLCLGCIIQGETRHFDFVAQGITDGLRDLNIKYDIPFIFGVLTTDNQQQAKERAGGLKGNKGEDAAVAALKMLNLKNSLNS